MFFSLLENVFLKGKIILEYKMLYVFFIKVFINIYVFFRGFFIIKVILLNKWSRVNYLYFLFKF